jgi:hypothetical protein
VLSSDGVVANLIDPARPGSFVFRCRQRRHEEFNRRFPDLENMRVLDLGGTVASWRASAVRPLKLTLVNLSHEQEHDSSESWMEVVYADACTGGFGKYDLVFSNSLLEHLGGHARRRQFADVVHESAPYWWVQTPYRYFPVEPHWVFPGFQFLPFRVRQEITQRWKIGHVGAHADTAEAARLVAEVELISVTEMRSYFPAGDIWFERFAGLPKSLVAVKAPT